MLKSYFTLLLIVCYQLIGFCQMNPNSPEYPYNDTPETKKIALQITKDLSTDSLKVVAIYDWVKSNIVYDSVRFEKIYIKKEIEKDFSINNCSSTLSKRKAVCSGFSFLFASLCENVGVDCFPIYGYARIPNDALDVPNHIWAVFKINQKWYLADPTWDSNDFEYYTKKGLKDFPRKFFMVEPNEFLTNHLPLDPLWQLSEKPVSFIDWRDENFTSEVFINKNSFNLSDTLRKFESLNSHDKFLNGINRIVKESHYSYIGFNELFNYYSKSFSEQANSYNDFNRKINLNNRNIQEMAKKYLPYKKEIYDRLNSLEITFKNVRAYYKQLLAAYPKNKVKTFNVELEEVERSFQQADEYLLEERKSINATIKQLESLRKK